MFQISAQTRCRDDLCISRRTGSQAQSRYQRPNCSDATGPDAYATARPATRNGRWPRPHGVHARRLGARRDSKRLNDSAYHCVRRASCVGSQQPRELGRCTLGAGLTFSITCQAPRTSFMCNLLTMSIRCTAVRYRRATSAGLAAQRKGQSMSRNESTLSRLRELDVAHVLPTGNLIRYQTSIEQYVVSTT